MIEKVRHNVKSSGHVLYHNIKVYHLSTLWLVKLNENLLIRLLSKKSERVYDTQVNWMYLVKIYPFDLRFGQNITIRLSQ